MHETDKLRLNQLADENGFFKSSYPEDRVNNKFSTGYLYEFCEFLYLNDFELERKLQSIKAIENEIKKGMDPNAKWPNFFCPTIWSFLLVSRN